MVLKLKEADKKVISQPADLAEILRRLLRLEDKLDQDKEHVYCVHLDTRSRIKLIEVVSIGVTNASLIHPREVFRRAILENASQILVAHNHPSGNCEPSEADLAITQKLQKAGEVIGIKLLDHLVFSANGYCSLRESALIPGA